VLLGQIRIRDRRYQASGPGYPAWQQPVQWRRSA
jgi:hypothetical protein